MSYAEEIIQKGTETLEKFLFLLKEDIILFEDRKQRDKNQFKNGEADLILEKMQKWLKQNENNEEILLSNQDYLDIRKAWGSFTNSSKSQFLASNAHFVYLFALFDQFILEIAKLSLKNDHSLMQNYKNYCVNFFERGIDKNLYKLLPYESELVDYFSKFPSPIKVITKILGIDFKKENFINTYFNYIEMKERRNLIVHRGGVCDELYLKTIKKYLSNYPQKKLNNFLSELEKNKNETLNINLNYFLETIQTLYFLVCLLVSNLISRVNSESQKTILFTQAFNDLLNFTLETDYGFALIPTQLELFELYKSEYLNNKISKMNDIDKVNWILCNEKYKEIFLITYNASQHLDNIEQREGEIIKAKIFKISNDKNKFLLDNIEDQIIKKIITAFLEKNFQTFTENVFLFAEREKILIEDIESGWYMHRKLSEEIEFRKIYSSYKKKNNPQFGKINLIFTDSDKENKKKD